MSGQRDDRELTRREPLSGAGKLALGTAVVPAGGLAFGIPFGAAKGKVEFPRKCKKIAQTCGGRSV